MFDNMTRLFSRKGSDQEELTTNSAILESTVEQYEDIAKPEAVERDIDAVSLDAPVINDMIQPVVDDFTNLDELSARQSEEVLSEEILSADDVLTADDGDDDDDDDDFESI